ncbi:uncharacterized protein METZ01_LOCUS239592 [marine metagenome]|uniref:Uncharacterized protein n=1 Tax=marine metagenome TaxID=408172 RepID=A0A382HHF8_9ZZZZ
MIDKFTLTYKSNVKDLITKHKENVTIKVLET